MSQYADPSMQSSGGSWADGVVSWIGRALGSEYPKALPPRLPWSAPEVARMLQARPDVDEAIRAEIRGTRHVHLLLGHQPTEEELRNLATVARVAVWMGNGTGDDLSRGEDTVRNLVIRGMQSTPTSTSSPTMTGPDSSPNMSANPLGYSPQLASGSVWALPPANRAGTVSVGFGPMELAIVGALVILAVKIL